MASRSAAGGILVGVGSLGVVVAIVASVVGWQVLGGLQRPLEGTADLTGQTVEALRSSLELTEDAVVILERGLQQTESTTRDLATAFSEAEAVAGATADISEEHVAESLDAVDRVMPTLVEVAGVMDRTLRALSAVPLAPDYRPSQPFDESLRSLQQEVRGLSGDLRDQAALLREGQASLANVREGTAAIADDMQELHTTLDRARGVVREYSATAARAATVVGEGQTGLDRQLTLARMLVVVLGVTLLAAQTVPLGLGWLLLRPDTASALLADRP